MRPTRHRSTPRPPPPKSPPAARLRLLAPLALCALAAPAWAGKEPEVLSLKRPAAGEWSGIYLLGHKAGYSFSRISTARLDGRPVVVVVEDTTLHATLGGAAVSRRVREEKSYEAKPGGRLVLFKATHEGDGGDESLVARCDRGGVHLRRQRPGEPEERLELPPSQDVVDDADLPRLAIARRASQSGRLFDGSSLRDKPERVDYLGPAEILAGGSRTEVQRVSITEDDGKVAAEVAIDAHDGRLLQLKFGGALLAVPEPEAVAKQLGTLDLFALTRVPIDRPLRSGEVPATLRFLVTGLPKGLRPAPERQRYRELPGGAVEVTVRAEYPTHKARRPESNPADELGPTPAIESGAPEIRALARKLVGEEPDALVASDRLSRWVFENLRKAYGVSSDRATDVLRRREGDCTEHSLLAVALARAAGIPARLVHGLVYAQGGDGVFGLYWHEWIEVWTGEWVAIDPTFGQPVADATHLELGEGDETDSVALMGQLKISVLEGAAP